MSSCLLRGCRLSPLFPKVCKRWRTLLSVDDLWRKKCLELGKSNGLQNLPNDIVASVAPPIQWKRQFHHWHRKFKDRGRKQAEAAKSKRRFSTRSVDEAAMQLSASKSSTAILLVLKAEFYLSVRL